MRRRLFAALLSLVMLLEIMPPVQVHAAGGAPGTLAEGWFYEQLSSGARGIYSTLEKAYKDSEMKDGKANIILEVSSQDVSAYMQGNRTLFHDFSAAKDAFDLEHPEAWYIDSAKLALTAEGTTASVGTGYTTTYYVDGIKDAADVAAKSLELESKITGIVNAASDKNTYEKIKDAHNAVINSISYRYETECASGNAGFIRTAYALVTGEGVCEGYARSFQMILDRMGIPCVLVHGTQMSGNPEAHMWCAVYIADEKSTGWYVVDPTWDDPVPSSQSGTRELSSKGIDGGERLDYFMVGNDVTGSDWIPSGRVSTGAMEFKYPSISPRSYGAGLIESNGLVVTYDDGLMEGTSSTVYRISYNGKGLYQSSQDGIYFLTKMCDINADGSVDEIGEWYYPVHMLLAMGTGPDAFDPDGPLDGCGNAYYQDKEDYLLQSVSQCEFVEYAVTTAPPPAWETANDLITMGGDHTGKDDDIIAQTGPIYNPNGNYEQRPWVKNVTPEQNVSTYVGGTHTIHMEFTDPLFHPDKASIAVSAALGKVNEAETAMAEDVGLDYTGRNYSWGVNGGLPHQFAVKPEPKNVRWYCAAHDEIHTDMAQIKAYGSVCRLTTLEFEFTPSEMWADDSVSYEFYLTGLVGAKSNKKPEQTGMSFVFENESAYCMYRCVKRGGIDWNLWGQPQLLDDPNNLDFGEMVVKGTDGYTQSIEELYSEMNLDQYDMNGRLLLVVEDAGADRDKAETMSGLLETKEGVDLQKAVASALYEIDFARVCGKTVVETGDSLRMQVGFPAGFDASKLSTTVFKVYHFIKNADGKITGVEEIPVTVTPYGLVFQVNSFSPFAIVADNGTPDNSRSVVLVSSGNGTIEADGYTAGEGEVKGTLKLSSGQSCTIKITPDEGYALESITSSGLTDGAIQYTDGSFTLSYGNVGAANAMIGVTFVPIAGNKPDVPKVLSLCGHENVTSTGGRAATCTKDGETPTVICASCKQVLSGGEPIKATGHVYEAAAGYQEPTCTEPGTALSCKICNTVSQAPALGHDYSKGECVRKGCGAKEQYTVVFHANGGEFNEGTTHTVVLDSGTVLKAEDCPVPEWDGHKFNGWYTAAELVEIEAPEDHMMPPTYERVTLPKEFTKSMAVYANWTEEEREEGVYKITLDANGGTLSGASAVMTDAAGRLKELPKEPSYDGYTFKGWTAARDAGEMITLDTVFENDCTIYASWEKNAGSEEMPPIQPGSKTYTVTFDANGGTLSGSAVVATGTDGKLTSLPVPVYEGYTFDGWYTARTGGSKISLATVFTSDGTVYAHWTVGQSAQPADTYQISVSANPAGGGDVSGGGTYGAGKSVTVTADPASGYSFAYWMENGTEVNWGRTYTFPAEADRDLTAVFTLSGGYGGGTGTPGGSGSAASGSPAAGTAGTAVTNNPDGSVTTTVTDKETGTVTETTEYADGSTKSIETTSAGVITTTEARADGVRITTVKNAGPAITGSVSIPAGMTSAVVEIEAAVTTGTVAVDVSTGKVIMSSIPVGNTGLRMTLARSVSFRLENRSKAFDDMDNHWSSDSVAFVTAHGLFYGTGDSEFGPDQHMTRAMLITVLARLDGIDTEGGSTWYEKGMQWAMSAGISDGLDLESDITREQLATMLWRYAGEPAAYRSLSGYLDSVEVHDWAGDAMEWAVQNGIIQGSDGRLNPRGPALRSEVAAMVERFCKNVGV